MWPRAELSICVVNMENNQTKLQTVMNSALMEACPFGCFLREMSSFVHFNGKTILLHTKKNVSTIYEQCKQIQKAFCCLVII